MIGSLVMLLVVRYAVLENPMGKSPLLIPFTFNTSTHGKSLLIIPLTSNNSNPGQSSLSLPLTFNTSIPLELLQDAAPPPVQKPAAANKVISTDKLISGLFLPMNFSYKVQSSLQTWNHLKHLVDFSQELPNAVEAIRDAQIAWDRLIHSFERKHLVDTNGSSLQRTKEKQCPYFLNKMNATGFGEFGYRLQIPCGLIEGSSITIIGIPNGILGNFQIDLMGETLPGEPEPPIILHYNVLLHGDKITNSPVIIQNTWTEARHWSKEERCPWVPDKNKTVDDLNQCDEMVGKEDGHNFSITGSSNVSIFSLMGRKRSRYRRRFPFKQGYLSVMTLRVGEEGFQMTVDGKHTTSFAYHEGLEAWLVSGVKISGDLNLTTVLAIGLPTSEDPERIVDIEALRTAPLPPQKALDIFIGVFSTANNFKRRMAVRRTWMQYAGVKEGAVGVRFFVGLHKNRKVNEELWAEAQTFGDIQLMPFLDYYSVITWKTLAICIFGTQVVSAKYVMKADDDTFVRVDKVIASLEKANVTHGLLYGLINYDARPQRSVFSKWFITREEWPEDTYPTLAHGPGYLVSHDIAEEIYQRYKRGDLKMFKLEDVAMGIWISEMKKGGLNVSYVKEKKIFNVGCEDGYLISHYQTPRQLLCLWHKLQELNEAICCGNR